MLVQATNLLCTAGISAALILFCIGMARSSEEGSATEKPYPTLQEAKITSGAIY